jgi:hypothetical protein
MKKSPMARSLIAFALLAIIINPWHEGTKAIKVEQ